MDFDDLPIKKDSPLTAVEKEDLSTLSAHELEERISRLEAKSPAPRANSTPRVQARQRLRPSLRVEEKSFANAQCTFLQ